MAHLVFCRSWFCLCKHEFSQLGAEELVDCVKVNISGNGDDARRKREMGTDRCQKH